MLRIRAWISNVKFHTICLFLFEIKQYYDQLTLGRMKSRTNIFSLPLQISNSISVQVPHISYFHVNFLFCFLIFFIKHILYLPSDAVSIVNIIQSHLIRYAICVFIYELQYSLMQMGLVFVYFLCFECVCVCVLMFVLKISFELG